MLFAVIASSVFVYFFILTLFGPKLADIERVGKRLEKLDSAENENADEELSKPFAERIVVPMFSKLLKGVTKLSKNKNSSTLTRLERELHLAGITMPAGEFSALKRIIMFFCLGICIVFLFIPDINPLIKLLILLFGLILGILIPRYYLKSKIKKRQRMIRQQMPDVMDLLSVSVQAGLGFDAALLRVGEQASGPLMGELLGVYREIQMGKSRKEAFAGLSSRNSVEELKTFSGAMVQADQLGIPIRNVLSLQAQQLRLKRRQRAEEKAMKAPVKMMLPLVVFVFPVIFIILLGPSVIKIIQIFAG